MAYLVLSIFLIIGVSLVLKIVYGTKQKQIEHTQTLLLQEAKGHFDNIKNLEIWHNKFGGIFQQGVEDSESYNFNIYSLNPKNIENKAKGFALDGLEYFQTHTNESYYYKFDSNGKVLEFIGAMYTEQKCTACHTDFKVGELRGGIDLLQHVKHAFG